MKTPTLAQAFLASFLLFAAVFLGSCAYRVSEALEWDHANKCRAGLQPVDKKPCIREKQ